MNSIVDQIPIDMRIAVDRYNDRCEEVTKKFVDTLEADAPPPMIYHYTDEGGLRGILGSGTLRLGDIFTMNDSSELKHGLSHAVEILRDLSFDGRPEKEVFFKAFESLLTRGGVESVAHYFVGSLSVAGDDLGQWREYADRASGFSLGFEGAALERIFTKDAGDQPIGNNSTFAVTYDDDKLLQLLREIIIPAMTLISLPRGRRLHERVTREYMTSLYATVAVHCLRLILFFKNEAFHIEMEYRFLQLFRGDASAPAFKINQKGRKYREFAWKSRGATPLKRVMVGPRAEPGAEATVRDILKKEGYDGVIVDRSPIPYRG